MSKTVVSVLEVAAIVGLQFIPGVGTAVSGFLASAGIGGLTAAQGLTIATIALAGSEALLNSAIAPGAPKPPQTETALKSPTPPRVSGYGIQRLYMAYALYVTASDGTAVDVGVFHDGKIDGIIGYWLADTKIVLLSDGRVQAGEAGQFGELSDIVKIYTRLGNPTETAISQVVAKVPDQWTSNHRGDGCVTAAVLSAAVKSKNYQMIYPTGGPNQMPLSMAMRLQLVFDWRDPSQDAYDPATWKWSENAVLHLAHYLLVRDHKDWNTHFVPTLAYWTAAANDADLPVPLKGVQTIIAEAADAGSGHLTLSSVNGLATGMTIVISSTGDTSLTETRTVVSVAGNVVALSSNLANDHPIGSQVNWSSSTGSPATEPRYRGCVVHKHTDDHKGVIANILACFDGWYGPRADGALIVYSGRYYAPTVTIGPDEIVSYSLQDGIEEENAINQIAVSYVSANHAYNTVQTDSWEDADDIAARGKVLPTTLDNQVPSFSQARRLAKRTMARLMAGQRGTTTTNAAGKIARGQRFIRQQLISGGVTFQDAVVEITKVTRNLSTGGITYDWILADPNVDEWNPATEEGEPAPVGNRVAAAPLNAPTITSAAPDYSAVADDGTGVRITIEAAGLNRADVTWYARWRVVGAPSWNEQQYPDIDPADTVTIETSFVPTGQTVEVEVAYVTGDGRLSPYSDATTIDTATDTTPPDAALVPTLVSWTGSLNLQLEASIARARTYRWNFYEDDGTTLVATHETPDRSINYSASQAAIDGVRRSYVVGVQGVNSAGAGIEAKTGILSNDAPPAVTTPAIAGGDYTANATCDAETDPDVAGYAVFYSDTAGFDPATTGGYVTRGIPSVDISGLAAGTYYGHIVAFDDWSSDPTLLNLSGEIAFTIAIGGGSTPTGGGTGGGGYGGGCPEIGAPVLMANGTRDGPGDTLAAGKVRRGHYVWSQHYETGVWGAWRVLRADTFDADIWSAKDMPATTGSHVFLMGERRRCVRMDAIGSMDRPGCAVLLTIEGAEAFVIVMPDGRWIDNHNKRAAPV